MNGKGKMMKDDAKVLDTPSLKKFKPLLQCYNSPRDTQDNPLANRHLASRMAVTVDVCLAQKWQKGESDKGANLVRKLFPVLLIGLYFCLHNSRHLILHRIS